MRTISLAAAVAVGFLSISAYAQSQSPSLGHTQANSPAPAAKALAADPLKQEDVSKIRGTPVLGSDGKKVGDVATELMKPDDKTIDRLVVRTGGVFGLGGHEVALPIDAFSWEDDAAAFKISKTADDLKAMAQWTPPPSETTATGSSTPTQKPSPSSRSGQ